MAIKHDCVKTVEDMSSGVPSFFIVSLRKVFALRFFLCGFERWRQLFASAKLFRCCKTWRIGVQKATFCDVFCGLLQCKKPCLANWLNKCLELGLERLQSRKACLVSCILNVYIAFILRFALLALSLPYKKRMCKSYEYRKHR